MQETLQPNTKFDGYLVTRVTPLPNLRSTAYEITHQATGARIIHLHNADAENLFSITFPTPPPDDTGVPHILEHSVLAGSRKYRVKDPFFELAKSSMATFLNAMTDSDHTVYPVASNVRQDFFNLAEVYWDAAFHPLLTEQTFQREGHHLEFARKGDLGSDLIIKGIVYNEMKGARSSPESKVYDLIEKSLWPDTPYGKDSGGDPDHIPELTWQGLRNFHQTFYHPSNAYIFLYGDISTTDYLNFLSPRLAEFRNSDVNAQLPPQPRWSLPRTKVDVYPVAPTDPTAGKTFVVLNWLVGATADVNELFAFSALERCLLGNQAAPLRKALIDSKLGEDLAVHGFWANGVDSSFHIGLRGTEADRAEAVVKLVLDTLEKIADEGISPRQFDSAIQQLSYHYLEITPQYPLHLMASVTRIWQLGADPLSLLHADGYLDKLKRDFAADPRIFSRLIRTKLLDNTHRLTLVVKPDQEIQQKKDAAFTEKMRITKQSLSTEQLTAIARNQEELDELANEPNSPEAVASLPQLRVVDLPRKPRHIPTTVDHLPGGTALLKNDVFANGVNYLHLSFDLTGLPKDLYAFLPLYGDCIHKMGAAGQDYVSIAQRIAAATGGIGFSTGLSTRVDDPNALVQQATFSSKFLDDNAYDALALLRDLVFQLDPRDTPRLRDVLLQARSHQRTRPAQQGMAIALRHAGRGLATEGYLQEVLGGLPQIELFEKITEGPVDPLIEKIEAIRTFLLNRARVTASFTGSDKVYDVFRRRLTEWTGDMAGAPIQSGPIGFEQFASPPREGLAAPMNVAYCTMVMPAPHMSHADAPILSVATPLLSLNYVLDEVRFKGTAYGGGCGFNAGARTFSFHSYRDPWIHRTLDVYTHALSHVEHAPWSPADVDRAIISTAKGGEQPIRPPTSSGIALWRYLAGDTPARREARHEAMLGATLPGIKRVLIEQLSTNTSSAAVCVVSSREKLEAANRERPGNPLEVANILN
ncbi:MAG: insulinase family protein [Tepidisphaeraceae bacterium]|jgi:Zn-dependent M16 (insulinase) family peptidase